METVDVRGGRDSVEFDREVFRLPLCWLPAGLVGTAALGTTREEPQVSKPSPSAQERMSP